MLLDIFSKKGKIVETQSVRNFLDAFGGVFEIIVDVLHNIFVEQQNQIAEQQNQLSAMIKLSSSLGATPEQIAAQLNIPISDVESVIKGLTK